MNNKIIEKCEKQRRTNFSTEEKLVLMHCVSKLKNIIECKKTNGSTWHEKNTAWDAITREFNSQSPTGVYRNKESLKKCYENKKAEVRKLAANNKFEMRTTGGATFIPKTDPCLDILVEITNKKTIEGMPDEFGGDALIQNDIHPVTDDGNIMLNEHDYSNDEFGGDALIQNDIHPVTDDGNIMLNEHDYSNKILYSNIPTSVPLTPPLISAKSPVEICNEVETCNSENINFGENMEKNNWTLYKPLDLKRQPNKKLQIPCDRRRPKAVQSIHTNYISQQYSEVATLKAKYLKNEIELANQRRLREEEEFKLKRCSLELDIEIKQLQLKKLKDSFD